MAASRNINLLMTFVFFLSFFFHGLYERFVFLPYFIYSLVVGILTGLRRLPAMDIDMKYTLSLYSECFPVPVASSVSVRS